MTTLSELKKQVFKAENMQNLLHRDGEGWSFPYKAQEFVTLDTGGVTTEFGWTATGKCLFGQGPIEFRQIAPFDGTGAVTAFIGGTFGERLNPINCSVFATIGAAIHGWTDTDGTKQVITGRVLAYGNNVLDTFQFWVGTASVAESTFVLTHTDGGVPLTATSTAGVITGTNIASGTLDPITGEVNVVFTSAPDNLTTISVAYTVDSFMDLEHAETLATGNGTTTVFGALQTDFGGIRDFSVRVTATISAATCYFVDDGAGALVGLTAGTLTSGTVNQATGAIAMTFATAPDDGTNITVTYCRNGLNRSAIDYTTGTGVEVRFDVGSEPDNATKILLTGSAYAITEVVGADVDTGILSIGYAGAKAGFRTSRNYRDTGSEDYAGDKATVHSVPGERHVLSFYGKTSSGTAKCLIRAWTGTASNTQVSIGSTALDFGVLTGAVTRIVDPDDGSKFCLQCAITTTMTRFGAFVSGPVGSYCLSMEWIGDVTCTYTGEQSLWVSCVAFGTGTALPAYAPNPANFTLQRPRSNPNGVAGQVPVSDGKGGFTWTDPTTAGGAGISQLNGLSAGVQTFATGSGGTAPAFVSAGSTHTLNLPMASTAAVTAGMISKVDYDKFNAAASGTNAVSLIPATNDTIDIGASNFNWRTIYGVEGRFSYLGDRTATALNGGALDLAQYLRGKGALALGYNAYDTNVTGAVRGTVSNAGFLMQASGSNLTISMTEAGEAATNTGVTAFEMNENTLTIGRATKVWSANRLTDKAVRVLHPILSDYDQNFASPAYDALAAPLLVVRGVTSGTAKGPVIAFARSESSTLPIGGIWFKPAAAGSGLDKIVLLGSTNDTSWPTPWLEIDSSGLPGPTVSLIANSNGITLGNVVEITSAGTGQNVQNIYHCEAPTISSLATLDGTNNVTFMSASKLTSNSALVTSSVSSRLKAWKVTAGNPPTLSSAAFMSTNAADNYGYPSSVQLSEGVVALSGAYNGSGPGFTCLVLDGNPPSVSALASLGNTAQIQTATCALTSSSWFVAYASVSGVASVVLATSNGTNGPTLSSAGTPFNAATNESHLSLCNLTTNTAMFICKTGTFAAMAHITGAGTNAPSAGAYGALDGTNDCTYITLSPIDSTHTLCAYNNATTSQGMLAVIKSNGTNAPEVISRAVFTDVRAYYISLTSHSSNQHTLFYSYSNSYAQSKTLSIDSNYNITLSQPLDPVSPTNTGYYQAVAALTPTTAIGAWSGTGSDGFAGTLTLTPTPIISGQLVGVAATSATNGAAATIDTVEYVTTGLTAGADYYQAGAGGLSTNASPVHAGKAKSTTNLVVQARGAPETGKMQTHTYLGGFSGTLTIPSGVKTISIEMCAGGASGASGGSASTGAAGGGGGGYISAQINVVSGVATYSVGSGGAASGTATGNSGGSTSFTYNGVTYSCGGGNGGSVATCARSSGGTATTTIPVPVVKVVGSCGFNTAVDSGATGIGGNSAIGQGSVGAAAPTGFGGGSGGVYSGSSVAGGNGILYVSYLYG